VTVTRYVSLAAAALALVAMGLALWDLVVERDGNPRDSIRILLLAVAVLFVAVASLRRRDPPSKDTRPPSR
jgi:hypothetical protein